MFNFDLKKAAIFQAVKWEKRLKIGLIKILRKILFWLFLLFLILFLYLFLTNNFFQSEFLGLSILSLSFALIFWYIEKFFETKLKSPKLNYTLGEVIQKPEEFHPHTKRGPGAEGAKFDEVSPHYGVGVNFAEFLDLEAAKTCWQAIRFAKRKKLSQVPSEALFYYLLNTNNFEIRFIFNRSLLNLEEIKNQLKKYLKDLKKGDKFSGKLSQNSQNVILEAAKSAQRKGRKMIGVGDILTAQAQFDPIFKTILIKSRLKSKDIENISWWVERLLFQIEERKKFWEWKNLIRKGSLAKEWTAGYTITLDQFAIGWTDFIKRGFAEVIGHKTAIEQVERILARSEINNVLLIGEPGSGRGSIIQVLAQKCIFGESLPNLNYKRVVELNIPSLLARIEDPERVEATLDQIFREVVSAENIILVINEFHNFIGQLVRPGIIDISGVLSSYLKSPQFQIVAIATYAGLHKYIEQNPSILSLFEKVEVSEISQEETIIFLENLALVLEQKYKRFVSYPAIREIISLADKYLPAIPFPKKATDLLDEVMVYVTRNTKDIWVLPKHVSKIISEKTQIPVGEIEAKEKEVLLNLEKCIHQRIINQEEAVREVSAALRRARAEVTVRKGPMGCFLFLGPTGVGKTETSKAVAEICFGSETRMIRLDMSEFQDVGDIPRLIGSPGQEGLLTTQVRENPFSLILLDEIEKSHPNILNLFLQVLDEGHLTDGLGRKVDFKNTIIIATSNAGADIIWQDIKLDKKLDIIKDDLFGFLFQKGIFRPEFINRFDAVVVFRPLTKENLLDIAELLFQKLKKNLKEKEIEFIITQPLKKSIVELSYNPVFGAREMRRVIQDKVENVLASTLLSGQIKPGDKVEIDPKEFKLRILT